MNCDIIQDLLPLYADKLTSEASSRQIENHVKTCPQCRRLRNEMCAPLETEPEDEEQKIMRILQAQRKKQQRKKLITWVCVLLAFVLVVWGMMEIRFSGEEIFVSSTNEEKILKEMPGLALTDAEKELAKTILEVPMIRDALYEDFTNFTVFQEEDAGVYFISIMPDNAKIVEIAVMGPGVYFSYTVDNIYTIIVYNDPDMTGHVDTISKTVAVSSLDEIGTGGKLGDVKAVYEANYAVATDSVRYQKIKSRHMWFSFLNMP